MTTYQEALEYVISHPEALNELSAAFPKLKELYNIYLGQQAYEKGEIDANELLRTYGNNPNVSMSPDTEKWLDNAVARENVQQEQSYQTDMRNTSLLSTAEQLNQMGLSPSNVISVGGSASGVTSTAASNAFRSNSALRQQMKINKYNQKMSLAKSLIGAAGQMASSGIYGAAIGAVKHSAQAVAGSAAHSGLEALKAVSNEKYSNADLKAIGYSKPRSEKVGGFYSVFE